MGILTMFFLAAALPAGGTLELGDWGGAHIRLSVTDKGAEVEFDCGHGTLDAPLALDKDGRFDVKGHYVAEHGGPVLRDETERRTPARYEGSLAGGRMTLNVTIEGGDKLGPFELTRGGRARLMKCR